MIRQLLTTLTLLLAMQSFAQQSPEQAAAYQQFDLSLNDPRGVEFVVDPANCNVSYGNTIAAIEGFFATAVKRDYTRICIPDNGQAYLNQPMTVADVVDLYLELTSTQTIQND